MPTSPIGLGPQELSVAFPFHLAFDGESRILQVGSVIQRLLPDIRPGTNFRDHFRIVRPGVEPTFDAIRAQSHVFFMLESRASKDLVLRGQMLPLQDRHAMVFLGSPWVTEVAKLKYLRLSIQDFALHDPISDFLFLLQAQNASLADTGMLANELTGVNKELEERVKERTADLRLANRELKREISERKRAKEALRWAHTQLETRVAERTAELTTANAQLLTEIAERGRAEAEKLELQKQLHQGQKLEAIGTLAGGIAHEFNNLLWVILGNTERTLLKLSEGSPLRPLQEDVLTASKRAKGLVEQILAFSRRSEEASQPVQLNVLAKETLKLLRATLPATIEFRTQIDSTCGPVLGDIARVQQIIMNLCMNAYQAMGETGLLGVHVAAVEITPGSEHHEPDLKPGSYVLLEVSDTGSGMDAQTLERIFEPFFSTHEVGKGTGLGLPSVYGFVTAMGGVIKVDSVVGKGTTFRVYLPQCETGATRQQEQGPAIPEEAGGADILVVDDEPLVLSTLQGLLEALGYAVTVCETGRGALEFVRAEPGRFRLVITDQTMPQMTGLELTGQLHQIRPDLPVILVSGYTNVISEQDFQQYGVCTFLTKPVGFADLKRSVQEALVDHGRR